jgi:hypothetical protein
MDIIHMATTTRTTGRIRTMAIIIGLHSIGTADTDITTATIGITATITTTRTKVT